MNNGEKRVKENQRETERKNKKEGVRDEEKNKRSEGVGEKYGKIRKAKSKCMEKVLNVKKGRERERKRGRKAGDMRKIERRSLGKEKERDVDVDVGREGRRWT